MQIIKNCKVLLNRRIEEGVSIGIDNGIIKKIGKDLKGELLIDAKNLLVLPGGIDAHVHFRDPGFTYKEDWISGSKSALAGGITSVIDQPNTYPMVTSPDILLNKIEIAKKKSLVDFGVNAAVTNKNIHLIKDLAGYTTAFGEIFLGEDDEEDVISYDMLNTALKIIKDTHLLPTIHAEDYSCIASNKIAYQIKSSQSHLFARPNSCEEIATAKLVKMAEQVGCRMHICHISTKEAIKIIKTARGITCEVTPHHLLFSADDYNLLKTKIKVNPPIRDKADRNFLWNMVKYGMIDVIASDHAPHSIEEKEGDIYNAKSGIPGVETMIPLLLNLVAKDEISIGRLVELTSYNPAKIWGLRRKGFLKEGYDADLVLYNLKDKKRIVAGDLHTRCGWTPYEGFQAIFPQTTIIRGDIAFKNGEFYVKEGYGNLIKRV
ncbi:dihydroorotase [Candidatus Methanoliparum sp. LAM-1]|uniref:dihydroorotase n=1 Tax=Candidatus Methanoliparum sp. LAM-1 TaxID=2874846 RepID=UPI001E57F660|nr:dihydroorotase [Candidatus Methanoliparum sp. LAM-1]BDC36299.1 dihydroorotase [Candidatus Methanoliparum sp. LAM-1]